MVDSLKVADGQKAAEIDKLKHELHEQNKRKKFLSEEASRGRDEGDESEVDQGETTPTTIWSTDVPESSTALPSLTLDLNQAP
ncbi:uncharacterized protein A4U43_C08F14000 [Asparagus officinalis]|nr:uncharacterized protein A4U43_C08F14000 [Asparagus officinalis]